MILLSFTMPKNLFDDFRTMASEARYKAIKETKRKRIKILTPKQMLQRLPIALVQVKAGNKSDHLFGNRKTVYSLYRAKKIT